VKAFAAAYGAKFPKAAAKFTEDQDELLAFYDFPAEHWVHLRTTNPATQAVVEWLSLRHSQDADEPGRRSCRYPCIRAPNLPSLVR